MAYREQLLKDISGFEALNTLPYVNPQDIPSEDCECYICKEPYPETDEIKNCSIADNDSLQLRCGQEGCSSGDIPVRLHCGHIAGLQCLTQWVLFRNFDSYCPMCNTRIIPESQPATSFMSLEMVETICVLKQGDFSEKPEFLTTLLTNVAVDNSTEEKVIARTVMIAREFLEAFGDDLSRQSWEDDYFDKLLPILGEMLHDRKQVRRYIGKAHDILNGLKYQDEEGFQLRLLNGVPRDVSASIMGCCGFTDLNKSTAFLAGRMEEPLQQQQQRKRSKMRSACSQVVRSLRVCLHYKACMVMFCVAVGLVLGFLLGLVICIFCMSLVGSSRIVDILGPMPDDVRVFLRGLETRVVVREGA